MLRTGNLTPDYFEFDKAVTFPSALAEVGPYTVPAGTWPVTWEIMVSADGRDAETECTITVPGAEYRVLRDDLRDACVRGDARKV